MADVTNELLKTQLRQLRLPTMGREFEKLARDAASGNQTFAQFLLLLQTTDQLGGREETHPQARSTGGKAESN